jgi:ATP-dependent DNA helicase RecQ
LEGGFLVIYNALTIERIEQDLKRKFTKEDFKKLEAHNIAKTEQIHIAGEYAKKGKRVTYYAA